MATKHVIHKTDKKSLKNKKIIVCIDDGWYDPAVGNLFHCSITNVQRFFNTLLRDASDQKLMYFSGKAACEINASQNTGLAFTQIANEVYVRLSEVYEQGDSILLFGGGRGASVCFQLSKILEINGIQKYITYSTDENNRVITLEIPPCTQKNQIRTNEGIPVTIDFMGLWDMLKFEKLPSSITGLGFTPYELVNDASISNIVKKAVHLVAIDDHREYFEPALLNYKNNVEEIWCLGVHEAVIGGGRERMLSDITLDYMVKRSKALNVRFHEDSLEDIVENPKGMGVLSCEDHGIEGKRIIRKIEVMENGKSSKKFKPKIHYSVFERMKNKSNYLPPNVLTLKDNYTIVK